MASGRAADREGPGKSKRKAARSLDRDPISELHQGRRSYAPHRRAGHMTAPDHFAKIYSASFAGGGRPHMIFARRDDLRGHRQLMSIYVIYGPCKLPGNPTT